MNNIPGEGWANNIPLLPPPRVLNPYLVEQTPPPAEPDPSDPAEEENDPPPNVLLGEDGNAAADKPATDPHSDAPVDSDRREGADTTPAVGGNTQQPDDDGGDGEPPFSEPNSDSESESESNDDDDDVEGAGISHDLECAEDLKDQVEHEADRRLIGVYGDTVHRNDGRHLSGGVEDDDAMQMLYDRVVSYPHVLYSPPKGKVGSAFLEMLTAEFAMVRNRKSNSERALIFPTVILRRETGVVKAKAIRKRILRRMVLWEKGMIAELVQDTVATAARGSGGSRRTDDEENIARKYHSMVIEGRLRSAVRMLTRREGGGVLSPEDADTKTGRPVIDVLREKHPDLRIPDLGQDDWASFEKYATCRESVPVDCTQEMVEEVAGKLQGGAGPSSVDAIAMRKWLLRYGKPSQMLREELAEWTEWLSNTTPPWAAYRALVSCRLVALDKVPGVRPLGIGEIWRRAIAKCALVACGEDAKAACGSTQLCAGLEAGIEGALHSVSQRAELHGNMAFGDWEVNDDVWEKIGEEGEVQESLPARRAREAAVVGLLTQEDSEVAESWEDIEEEEELETSDGEVLLLVDAANGFNNLSRLSMLWTLKHRCPKLSRFAFNCYRHEICLVCRRTGQDVLILLSREGVTQGDPLAMALYGIALLPLAERLRTACADVLQPWFADDAAMQGSPSSVAECFKLLLAIGPHFGYYPEPAKSFAICPLATEAAAKLVFDEAELPVQFCRGNRYVGGYVGSTAMQDRWVEPKVAEWVDGILALSKVAGKYPQSAFAGFTQSLQSEWQYMCRCVPGVEKHFGPIEEAIAGVLIPALLAVDKDKICGDFRRLLTHGVKQCGLNIRNPVDGAGRLHLASSEACEVLAASLMANTPLDLVEHKACVRQAGAKARKERVDDEKEFVAEMAARSGKAVKKRLARIGESGAWLTQMPDKLNGTLLSM